MRTTCVKLIVWWEEEHMASCLYDKHNYMRQVDCLSVWREQQMSSWLSDENKNHPQVSFLMQTVTSGKLIGRWDQQQLSCWLSDENNNMRQADFLMRETTLWQVDCLMRTTICWKLTVWWEQQHLASLLSCERNSMWQVDCLRKKQKHVTSWLSDESNNMNMWQVDCLIRRPTLFFPNLFSHSAIPRWPSGIEGSGSVTSASQPVNHSTVTVLRTGHCHHITTDVTTQNIDHTHSSSFIWTHQTVSDEYSFPS